MKEAASILASASFKNEKLDLKTITITEILAILIITISLTMLLQYHWKRRRLYKMAAKIPGPKCYPIVGSAFMFVGTTEKILLTVVRLVDSYRLPVKVWLGNRLFFVTSDPDHLETIFNHPKAIGKDDFYKFCAPFVGEGLFSAPVEKWKKNRKIISPAFNQRILNNFVPIFSEQITVLEHVLKYHINKVIDIGHFVDKCSLDIICETSMGIKVNAQRTDSDFGKWVERLLSIFYQRMFKIWYHPDIIFYNLPIGREFKMILKQFINYTDKVVAEKKIAYSKQKEWAKEFPEAQTDEAKKLRSFLDLLIELTEEGDIFTDAQLRDEVNTFLIAGSDTTTSALSFAFVMLGMHPELQQKVYEEAIDVLGPDRCVEYTDLPKLKYTERFIHETNRLFPIGPLVVRANENDIQLGNDILPAGSSTVLVIHHTHRSPKYWSNPIKFDPDRFLPEEIAKRHPYAYMPFTGGPRICIGKRFAIMMLKASIAQIIRKFKFSTPFERVEDIRLKQDLIMKPVDGYQVKLTIRD